jgi:hypothetical protein
MIFKVNANEQEMVQIREFLSSKGIEFNEASDSLQMFCKDEAEFRLRGIESDMESVFEGDEIEVATNTLKDHSTKEEIIEEIANALFEEEYIFDYDMLSDTTAKAIRMCIFGDEE